MLFLFLKRASCIVIITFIFIRVRPVLRVDYNSPPDPSSDPHRRVLLVEPRREPKSHGVLPRHAAPRPACDTPLLLDLPTLPKFHLNVVEGRTESEMSEENRENGLDEG